MTTVKEVSLKIESVIENLDPAGLPDGEAERNQSLAEGYLKYTEGGEAILMYREESEGGAADSEITVKDGAVTVKRMGAIESTLYFKEGETHNSVYSVPPYKFDASVYTKRVRLDLTADGGKIDLFYNMKIGGAEKNARMKIWISLSSNHS